MKVTVKDYLNVRVGKPSVNAPTYQYLAPGSEIEVDGQLYKGDLFEGTDTWYKDEGGNYYWSGGTLKSVSIKNNLSTLIDPSEVLVRYNKVIQTNVALPQHVGTGINIALLDSGVNINHKDLSGAIVTSQNFIDGNPSIVDPWGHGTMMAGLIGGRSKSNTGIVGVAPGCSLFNYKVCDDGGNTDMKALKNALQHIQVNQTSLNIKIINLSLSISDLDFISAELTALSSAGIHIVVAAGTEGLFKHNVVRLLAQHKNTIGVGVIGDKDYIKNSGVVPAGLDCFYFNQKLFSCSSAGKDSYKDEMGDSIYTALTTGMIATLLGAGQPISDFQKLCFSRNLFSADTIKPYH